MKYHEDVCVFYKSLPTYNPQMQDGPVWRRKRGDKNNDTGSVYRNDTENKETYLRVPVDTRLVF